MRIETNAFWDAVDRGDTGLTNIHGFMKDLVSFYNFIKNQEEIFVIDDNVIEDSLKNLYEGFGITSNEYKVERRNYLLIIDPNIPIAEQYSDFFGNVSENCIPTHLVVLSNDKDVCIEYLEKIKSSYPEINMVQDVTKKLTRDEIASKIKKTLNTDLVFDITDYCERLSREFRTSPKYLDMFDSLIDEIHNDNKDRLIYICCGDYNIQNIYTYVVSELYLRYSDRFYCTSAQMPMVLNRVATTLNTTDFYMFDEFSNYIRNIPSVLVESRHPDGFITHLVNNKDLIFSLIYTEIEDNGSNDVFDTSMSISEIEIKSILDFYDLATKEGCNYLKTKIDCLYKLFKLKTGIVGVSDLIVFQKLGKTYIGYVYNRDVKIDTLALSPYAQIKDEINLDRLKKCVPISLFLDGIPLAESIYKSLNIPFNREQLFLPKQLHKLVILLNTGTYLANDEWDSCNLSIIDVGLSSKFTYSVHLSFYKYFENIIGLEKTRDLCDCFGGFNPKLCRIIKI